MSQKRQQLKIWQYFILVMSIFSLVVVGFQTFGQTDMNESKLLIRLDFALCILFFTDFLWQLATANSKWEYMRWGWLDFLSSIPMVPALRFARFARITRIIRVLRIARTGREVTRVLIARRARNTFSIVIFTSLVLFSISAIAIGNFDPDLSPGDAVWWCLFTLVTGEYGEYYPASAGGRVIAILLMTAGVALFGTFTATVASFFLEEDHAQDEKRDEVTLQAIEELNNQVLEIRALLEQTHKGD